MKKLTLLAATLMMMLFLMSNTGGCSEETYADGNEVTLHGQLRLIGNEPFTTLALHPEDGNQIRLSDDDRKKYIEYQGLNVTMSGIVKHEIRTVANSTQKFTNYILSNAVLIEE